MNIFLANDSKQGLGGGWSFIRNFKKAGELAGHVFTEYDSSNIYFISGATMVNRESVETAKRDGKRIVLRVDNIPRNSRNRNTGTSRLYDFAQLADVVIYQSQWARSYISPFLKKDGPVILNGVDTEIFNRTGTSNKYDGEPVYLYSRFNRDETKRWEEAWYRYQNVQQKYKNARLVIVGNFSEEQVAYNFDFFNNERFSYEGIIEDPKIMAQIYRGCGYFMMTYYNDACSNTLMEAMACGCVPVMVNLSGGTPEILDRGVVSIQEMFSEYERYL